MENFIIHVLVICINEHWFKEHSLKVHVSKWILVILYETYYVYLRFHFNHPVKSFIFLKLYVSYIYKLNWIIYFKEYEN